ncbi:MAG: spore cortex biosynthesis protein YabQ [Oscillospiraceae bacterium]|nr:spore cortex biosynthesis protein YabQ [Oscillospiraceae bacterium]
MYTSIPDCFMIAFAVGLVFGLVYEALRIIRLIMRFRWAVFLCDVIFFILAAEMIMTLSEAFGSYVRIYTVMGFGAGVFTYIVTVGRLLNLAESAAAVAWRKTIGRIIRKTGDLTKKSFGIIAQKSKSAFGKVSKYCESEYKKRYEHLKSTRKKLYNKERLDKIGESEKAHVIKATVRRSS